MDKYEQAQREGQIINEILIARDMLRPLVEGMIERGHCVAGQREAYGAHAGKRKATIKDAMRIAKDVTFLINRAIAEFDKKE